MWAVSAVALAALAGVAAAGTSEHKGRKHPPEATVAGGVLHPGDGRRLVELDAQGLASELHGQAERPQAAAPPSQPPAALARREAMAGQGSEAQAGNGAAATDSSGSPPVITIDPEALKHPMIAHDSIGRVTKIDPNTGDATQEEVDTGNSTDMGLCLDDDTAAIAKAREDGFSITGCSDDKTKVQCKARKNKDVWRLCCNTCVQTLQAEGLCDDDNQDAIAKAAVHNVTISGCQDDVVKKMCSLKDDKDAWMQCCATCNQVTTATTRPTCKDDDAAVEKAFGSQGIANCSAAKATGGCEDHPEEGARFCPLTCQLGCGKAGPQAANDTEKPKAAEADADVKAVVDSVKKEVETADTKSDTEEEGGWSAFAIALLVGGIIVVIIWVVTVSGVIVWYSTKKTKDGAEAAPLAEGAEDAAGGSQDAAAAGEAAAGEPQAQPGAAATPS